MAVHPVVPEIHASLSRNDFLTIVHKSSLRQDAFVAAWDCGRTLVPYLLNSDDTGEAMEPLESFGGPQYRLGRNSHNTSSTL